MEEKTIPICHDRICNLIVSVLTDQALIIKENLKKLNPEKQSQIIKLHDAILEIRKKGAYYEEIKNYITENLDYIDNPDEITDKHYYELIVDAMVIIYYDDFFETPKGSVYANQCKDKYKFYLDHKEE